MGRKERERGGEAEREEEREKEAVTKVRGRLRELYVCVRTFNEFACAKKPNYACPLFPPAHPLPPKWPQGRSTHSLALPSPTSVDNLNGNVWVANRKSAQQCLSIYWETTGPRKMKPLPSAQAHHSIHFFLQAVYIIHREPPLPPRTHTYESDASMCGRVIAPSLRLFSLHPIRVKSGDSRTCVPRPRQK